MSLQITRSDWFIGDLEHHAAWYDQKAGWDVAEQYLRAVDATVRQLADMPDLGPRARFKSQSLLDLRFYPVQRPFEKYILFYRHDGQTLFVERIIHGARDLPRRLTEPPASS